jgi:hypothetical protein
MQLQVVRRGMTVMGVGETADISDAAARLSTEQYGLIAFGFRGDFVCRVVFRHILGSDRKSLA